MPKDQLKDLLIRTNQRLHELADPAHAIGVERFFKEPVRARGVRSPALIDLSAELYREIKNWPISQRDQFVTQLWKDPTIENGGLACYIYRRFAKTFGEREFRLFDTWLGRYASNWGHVDGLCIYLFAPAIAHVPALASELPAWTRSKNRWRRRAAAVALVKEAKAARNTKLIFQISEALANDPEDLVQKGAGWLLKETYPAQPAAVIKFLMPHRDWPRVVLRYAAEKMSAQDKAAVLSWDN